MYKLQTASLEKGPCESGITFYTFKLSFPQNSSNSTSKVNSGSLHKISLYKLPLILQMSKM